MRQLTVELGVRSYPILIGTGLLSGKNQKVKDVLGNLRGNQVCIVTNESIAPLYLESIEKLFGAYQTTSVVLPDGEEYKNLTTLEQIFTGLIQENHTRRTTLVALGGGVIGDMTGYAAASYQRGVDYIQIPTTLLSQVDSSVGGKTGVNHQLGKNMIGAFKQPIAVFIDLDTLATLPAREFSAGLAEVIKYGLIWDAEFFGWLEQNIEGLMARDNELLAYAIERSCAIKAEVVAKDETEQDLRAILNLGHTFGHAIETHTGYGNWLHGEAVAAGLTMAVTLSNKLKQLDESVLQRTIALLKAANLPTHSPDNMSREDFLKRMSVDKKNIDHRIRLVLLKKLGQAYVTTDYRAELLNEVLDQFVGQ